MLQFLPTELLYTPVKTHAGLQYVCLRSLIVSIVMFYTEIRHLEPPISVLPLAKALLRLVIVLAVAVLRSILSAVKTVSFFVVWLLVRVLFTNMWVVPMAVRVAFLATATSAVCVVSGLSFMRHLSSFEPFLDAAVCTCQTVLQCASSNMRVVGQWVASIACIVGKFVESALLSRRDYDSPETKKILA